MRKKLTKMILAGNTRFNTDLVAAYIGTDEDLFSELIFLMHNGKPPVPQRAAWIMTAVTDKYPWLLIPYIKKIVNMMPSFNHPGVVRGVLRQFCQIDFPGEIEGKIFEMSYNFLIDAKQPVAIRVYAMQILFNISEKEPDLKNELKLILESLLDDTTSGGIISRAGKLLKQLNKY
jgi:hypothetical protein